MTRRRTLLLLILIALLGSFVNFYATNLFMNTLSDKDMPSLFFIELNTSLPALLIAFMFILATFYVFRLYLHPTHVKKLTRIYGIILSSFSLVGFILILI